MRNRTSNFRIPRSDALPLSHRDPHGKRLRSSFVPRLWQDGKKVFLYFFTELKIHHLSYFYLQTLRYRHCWSKKYARRVSYELRNRPRSPWGLCGSVVEHRSAESRGLRFDSSWGLRIFSFVPRSWQDEKNIFLYFFTELKTEHLSYFYLYRIILHL